MTDLDHALTTMLRDAAEPGSDPHTVVAGALARGARLRRRRRIGTSAAGLAAVAVVTGLAGVAVLPGPAGSTRVADPGLATAPAPSSITAPTPQVPAPRRMAVPPGRTAEVLASLLPGATTDPHTWHGRDFRSGSVLLDGALVTVIVERRARLGPGDTGGLHPCDEEAPPIAACGQLGDGDWSWGFDSYPESSSSVPTGVCSSSATTYTRDGFTITATAYNAPAEKDAAPVLVDPVLDSDRLTQVVTSDVWLR